MLMLQYSHVTHAITLYSTLNAYELHDCTCMVMRYESGRTHSHDTRHVCALKLVLPVTQYPIVLHSTITLQKEWNVVPLLQGMYTNEECHTPCYTNTRKCRTLWGRA